MLVATDGSSQARAAVAAAAVFPWPAGTRPEIVVARGGVVATRWPAPLWAAWSRAAERAALDARRVLRSRWPHVAIAILDQSPVEGIVGRARRLGARAVVAGSHGHAALTRFFLGSVSRGLVRRAPCPVLVVKRQAREVRRLVVGLDGSANSRRAAAFVASLPPPARGRVTVVRVVEPVRLPSLARLPAAIRARLRAEAAALHRRALGAARRQVEAVRERLERAGWAARSTVATGVPLAELVRAVAAARADLLVLGARGVGGLTRHLLGSVAEGALSRSPVSVLVVK